ncbi:hypothetical protein [Dickeya chrysanthemi]|uniref:hypothetical protein n=1 Tax=Dickeya chrysanthemi TaxID=556 RepID=UPI001CF4529D|nr:hypothetical protein [Dickeya chrysanthemi]MCA7008454.1 hypothetical protein [Dickeya chrysanthemi]
MRDFNVPTEFLESDDFKKSIDSLNELRERDDDVFEIEYRKKIAKEVFDDLSRIVKERLNEHFGDHYNIDYDKIYSPPSPNPKNEVESLHLFIWQRSFWICENLSISRNLFQPLTLEILIHIIEKRENHALKLYEILLYPFYYADEKAFFSVNIGRTGGRPQHKHKDETMKMANSLIASNKSLSIDEISATIYQKMSSRYNDSPKLLTIRNWIIKSTR